MLCVEVMELRSVARRSWVVCGELTSANYLDRDTARDYFEPLQDGRQEIDT